MSKLTKIRIKGLTENIPVTTDADNVIYDTTNNNTTTVKDKIDDLENTTLQLQSIPRIIETSNHERILAFYPETTNI